MLLIAQPKISESRWTLMLASLLIVGMLVAFHWIVRDATQTGELRRQATAAQALAMMRCNALPSWDISRTCMKELNNKAMAHASIGFGTALASADTGYAQD